MSKGSARIMALTLVIITTIAVSGIAYNFISRAFITSYSTLFSIENIQGKVITILNLGTIPISEFSSVTANGDEVGYVIESNRGDSQIEPKQTGSVKVLESLENGVYNVRLCTTSICQSAYITVI